jgi:hypothetical protein
MPCKQPKKATSGKSAFACTATDSATAFCCPSAQARSQTVPPADRLRRVIIGTTSARER